MGDETKIIEQAYALEAEPAFTSRTANFEVDEDGLALGLIPEWRFVVEGLKESPRGMRLLRDDTFRDHFNESSADLVDITARVRSGEINFETITPSLARQIYYMHPPLIQIHDRTDVFVVAAEGMSKELELLTENSETFLMRARRLASISEELGLALEGAERERYLEQSYALNKIVADADSLSDASSPRKLHARASLHDALQRSYESNADNGRARADLYEYFGDLSKSLSVISEGTAKEEINPAIAGGALGELMVRARGAQLIIEHELVGQIECAQSSIRQDTGPKPLREHGDSPDYSWNWSFDLVIRRKDSGLYIPIEVKKRRYLDGAINKEESLAEEEKLHELYMLPIRMIYFRLGYNFKSFLAESNRYVEGSMELLQGRELPESCRKAFYSFTEQVDGVLLGSMLELMTSESDQEEELGT